MSSHLSQLFKHEINLKAGFPFTVAVFNIIFTFLNADIDIFFSVVLLLRSTFYMTTQSKVVFLSEAEFSKGCWSLSSPSISTFAVSRAF